MGHAFAWDHLHASKQSSSAIALPTMAARHQQQFGMAEAHVRCATLMGHVDHGKSSYADSLLASNNIISARQAGKLRYLDSRQDEQERGITMESSAVSLGFKLRQLPVTSERGQDISSTSAREPMIQDYMINLIDTPGHVDFTSEVSSASRLCDGSLIIVDVVEGVCTQTINVLRQAWDERLAPILVVNKMDRLVTELKLSPSEAHHHLIQLLEQVNAVMGSFFASERMEDDLRWHEEREARLKSKKDTQGEQFVGSLDEGAEDDDDAKDQYQELDDEDIYFDPTRGNVIFASAMDTWAFRLDRFSRMYSQKLGVKESKFRNVLWGDYYFDPKSKRVIGHKQREREGRNLKPVFVQFVLENIWAVYEAAEARDQEKIEKIVKALGLKIHPRDLRAKDSSSLVQSIFSQWLPLASCTFSALVSNLPSPAKAQRRRIPKMLHPDLNYFGQVEPRTALERDLFDANTGPDARPCAYIGKMFAIARGDLPEGKRRELTADEMRQRGREARQRAQAVRDALNATGASQETTAAEGRALEESAGANPSVQELAQEELTDAQKAEEVVLGFARLYSGIVKVGQELLAILPKYDTARPPRHPNNVRYCKKVKIEGLYMMMGRDLVAVSEVPAGNVFAVRGIEGVILRNGTLCGSPSGEKIDYPDADCIVNLAGVNKLTSPIVRVALEPKNPSHMSRLVEGLRLLNQADPCVETLQQSSGEHVIICAGELHLERCLKDLRERFAKCAIQVSPPSVPFRETTVKVPDMPPPKTEAAARGTIKSSIVGSGVAFTIRAVPLPSAITDFLVVNARAIKRLLNRDRHQQEGDEATGSEVLQQASGEVSADVFFDKLNEKLSKCGPQWSGAVDKIWSMGPRRSGPNLLIDVRGKSSHTSLKRRLEGSEVVDGTAGITEAPHGANDELSTRLGNAHIDNSNAHPAHMKSSETRGIYDIEEAIDTGFQLATLQGPICAEPMQGLAFFVEDVVVGEELVGNYSQFTSSTISAMREACRNGMLDWSPRLMLAMYACDIQSSTDVLGKVHGVLSRRRGRITSEEMKEGTSFFTVGAMLPVVESFGFADEIRKRTSGAASPQLVFKGFEIFDIDPYWVPRTEEELEDLGEHGERENIAKKYMDRVRKRKGLFVSKRIVEAEKQKTLKTN